jgi:DNA-binding GntR family transcriptional regulator
MFFTEEAADMDPIGYRALAMRLRYQITEETGWPAGTKLPSGRQLAARYRTTPATMRHALELLATEGLIVMRPGKGTFITEGHDAHRRRAEIESHLRDKASYMDDLGTAEYLARTLGASAPMVRRVLLRLIEEGLLRKRPDGTYVST